MGTQIGEKFKGEVDRDTGEGGIGPLTHSHECRELRCCVHNRGGPLITRHIAVNGTAGSVHNIKSGPVPS